MPHCNSRCCSSSTPSSCPKKYLTGTLCNKKEISADCFADHSPSREAFGVLATGAPSGTRSILLEQYSSKNILCARETAAGKFEITFKAGTFVCGPTAIDETTTFRRHLPVLIGGPELDIDLDTITFNGDVLTFDGTDNQLAYVPISVKQEKTICDLTDTYARQITNSSGTKVPKYLPGTGNPGVPDTTTGVVLATCPDCAGTGGSGSSCAPSCGC